jgi:very-short-patch-repair endonuclease
MPIACVRWTRRNSTQADLRLWQLLNGPRFSTCPFRRQVWIGPYVVDFFCNEHRLIVEVGGAQRGNISDYDATRSAWLSARGYRKLRFRNDDVLARPEAVSQRLWQAIEIARVSPGEIVSAQTGNQRSGSLISSADRSRHC